MSGQVRIRIGASVVVLAAVVAVVALLGLGTVGDTPVDTSSPSRSPAGVDVEGIATFDGEGFAFEYPAAWRWYPIQATTSFFSVSGYLASEPIDTSRICTTLDNGTSCNFRGYELQPGGVAIEIAGWGTPMSDPLAFWDRPEEGRRIVVGGSPAIVSQEDGGPGRVILTWKIAKPDALGSWIQLDADLAGPANAVAVAQVQALVASFRFDKPPTPLDPDDAADLVVLTVRALRAADRGYECFPERVGEVNVESVTNIGGYGLSQALRVTCTTEIAATSIGFWRVRLTAAWDAEAGQPAGTMVITQWLTPGGMLGYGSNEHATPPYCCT